MGESEVKSAALWLGQLVIEEIKYLDGVTGKVEALQTELNALAAFIQEAVRSRCQDARVRTAISEARRLAYDCEDVIEMYIVKVARHEPYEGGALLLSLFYRWACIFREAIPLHEIRCQLDNLSSRILSLKSDLRSYGITGRINKDDTPRPSETASLRRIYTHEREERVVVGLQEDVEELVERLMDPTDKTIIAITGMGGLGKSTLAAELYHHPRIRGGGGFEAFGWANASRRFQAKRVFRTLLYSLVDENNHEERVNIDWEMKADRARPTLFKIMKRVKCIVIVDDIWTSNDWAQLEAAFPRKSANGSRVILTTRNQDILSSSNNLSRDQVYLHPVKGLDDDNSWELFQKIVFFGGICQDSTKKSLGLEIIQHCKGVPLAIVVVGKTYERKESVEEWKQMHDNFTTQIKKGGASPRPYKEVYDVLQVSYDELPHHLKKCFLHLANYPEDRELRASTMYTKWAGEGIVIKEHQNNTSEDEQEICERYLEELVSRNMVQVEERWDNGSIITIRMHDLMRDVCIDIAKREGSFQAVNCQSLMLLRNTLPLEKDKGLRNLAVYVSTGHQNSSSPRCSSIKIMSRAPNLRSLFIFPITEQEENVECTKLMETICEDYPLLRVFCCEDINMTGKLPRRLGYLIHLRYLSLYGTGITELPSSIEKLQSLLTLDLRVSIEVENLVIPNVLWKMKQLAHVYLPFAHGPHVIFGDSSLQRYSIEGGGVLKLGGLRNLHTLLNIDLDRIDSIDFSNLKRLKYIIGTCKSNKIILCSLLMKRSIKRFSLTVHAEILNENPLTLSRCHVLIRLELYVEPHADIHLHQPLKLPNSLIDIEIWYVQLDEDPLPVLEKLPHLATLGLHMCYDGLRMSCSASGFPQLTSLVFEGLPYFRSWNVEQGALQKLKDLHILYCAMKKAQVPDSIPNTANVRFHTTLISQELTPGMSFGSSTVG